jgi:multidrug efflux pump subunit AcrA (membrane-fusion protein)
MTTTPRIRQELRAIAVEEAGVNYFDVSDPRSGATMRMYDFEWLIAQRMDGASSLGEVASWASARFGFAPTADDLGTYARKLAELGLVEENGAVQAPAPVGQSMELTIDDDEPEIQTSRPAPAPIREEITPDPMPVPLPSPAHAAPPVVTPMAPVPVAQPPRPLAPPPAPRPVDLKESTARVTPISDTQPPRQTTGRTRPPAEPKKSSPLLWVLALVVLGGGGFLVWTYVIAPEPAHVKIMLAPSPREVVRYYDGKGTVARSEPLTLSFGESGKVGDVVAPGTDAKAGMTLASLESATAIEKELADVKDREAFYAGQLKAASAKGKEDEVKKFQDKVNEKQKKLTELEERLKKARLVAPGTAAVAEVLVSAGAEVKEGDPAVKLVDKRMVAEFKLAPADAAAMKAGTQVSVAGRGAPAQARVLNSAGPAVKVELLDDGGGAVKPGDAVQLVKNRTPNVVVEPAVAVGKSQGGADQVWVLSNGVLHARPVTVVGRAGDDAYITAGLTTGESVVVSPQEMLQENQKAISE